MHDVVLAWPSGVTGATSFATIARLAGLSCGTVLLSGATSFATIARLAGLSCGTVLLSGATSFATIARFAGLSCAWVATWADDPAWLVAVVRPRKKDSAKRAMTVKTMPALRLVWVEAWLVST